MKKHKKIYVSIVIIILLILFNFLKNTSSKTYEILKVINADEFYIDFNHNKKIENNELIKLYGINAFKNNKNEKTNAQCITANLSLAELLILGTTTESFAERTFTNKKVKVDIKQPRIDKQVPQAKLYLKNYDIAKIFLNNGYATATEKEYFDDINYKKINENKKELSPNDFVLLNKKNNIFHKTHCQYVNKIKNIKAYKKETIPPEAKPCQACFSIEEKIKEEQFQIKNFDFKTKTLNFYFTDFNKSEKPDNTCKNAGCKALLNEINKAKYSIDFALYGYANQPQILNALISAQNRGVKIRWVTDADSKNKNIYKEISKVQKLLTNYKTDNLPDNFTSQLKTPYINAIMHNKFFIFDKETLWVSSANISQTDLADFNSNVIMLAHSKTLASIFLKEFEQMYNGKFHNLKKPVLNKENLKIEEDITISVYFSPTDNIIPTKIIPHINNAKKYIYISSFIITHNGIKEALINAKNKGIEIKVITDATSANGKYSIHENLRKNNIKTKVENKTGKMHTKSLIIDDQYTIFGSMNLTKSGTNKNDETIIILKNTNITKRFKSQFLYLWNSIPEKWATKTPKAESKDSKGSCSDGIDNDFDGFIDKEDTSCTIK